MKAKYSSVCHICLGMIWAGQPILQINKIGWVHLGCESILDTPLPKSEQLPYLSNPCITFRDRAEYTYRMAQYHQQTYDTFMETPDDDPFGYSPSGPIDSDDLPW